MLYPKDSFMPDVVGFKDTGFWIAENEIVVELGVEIGRDKDSFRGDRLRSV